MIILYITLIIILGSYILYRLGKSNIEMKRQMKKELQKKKIIELVDMDEEDNLYD